MRIVGLTGGIASGKSTVGRLLIARDVPVIDADQVSRSVVEPGSPGLAELVEAFGEQILDVSGALDRAAMRQRISEDPEARASLNRITHPRIREQIATWLATQAQGGAEIAVVEAALLVETGSHEMYPELWVVSCEPETQLARLMARDGMPEAAARALIATQLPLAEKEAVATMVFRNDGTPEALESAVEDYLQPHE